MEDKSTPKSATASEPSAAPDAQKALWNGPSGQAWVESQALMDQLLRPFEDALVQAVAQSSCASLLDVGCGTGATTLALAKHLGSRAHCTGLDVSEPMLALARTRAAEIDSASRPEFVLGDAQRHAFAPHSVDTITSRFGVMFFDDPVAAFSNLHRAAKADGRLELVVWRSASENPFMTAAERAAAPFLPALPPRRPDEPGQFAFGDAERVRRILTASGWHHVALETLDATCSMPERELSRYVTRFGPVARVLAQADADVKRRVQDAVTAAMAPYIKGESVSFVGACWLVRARAAAHSIGIQSSQPPSPVRPSNSGG
jgi:SAM-dependent methyltransferase